MNTKQIISSKEIALGQALLHIVFAAVGDYSQLQGCLLAEVRAGLAQSTSTKHPAQAHCTNTPPRWEVLVRKDFEFPLEDAIYCGRNWTIYARRSLGKPHSFRPKFLAMINT